MTSDALQRRIDQQTHDNLRRLVEQFKSRDGVIPFVGAGMSVDFGFQQWAGFLKDQALLAHVESEVKDLLNRGLYEEGAELVMDRLERGAFQQAMEDAFGEHRLPATVTTGAVALLPRLPVNLVITTNFDRVVEWVFEKSTPSQRLTVIAGGRTQAVSKAFRSSAKVLIKIHGDVEDSEDRVLTKSEYDKSYGAANPESIESTRLTEVMRMILTRPLLFLGCSLERDRVVAMLTRLAADLRDGLYHFAIVAAPRNERAFADRHRALGLMGIRPIWYPEDKFDDIKPLLERIVDQLTPSQPTRKADGPATSAVSEGEIDEKYWDGTGFLRARQYEKALALFQQVFAANPDHRHVRDRLKEAERNVQRERFESDVLAAESDAAWDKAVIALESLLQLSPGDASVAARLDDARRRLNLEALWEEAGELYRRKNWAAVIELFAAMTRLDPGVQDREGWLADARRELQSKETERLVKVHLREGIELFEAQEWGKALSALHRVLELDPDQPTARPLYTEAQAKVAAAEAAALLAERYRKATRAIAARDWDEAVELLNAVIREDADYRDASALLKTASEEAADASAQLELKLTAKPSPAPPDSEVSWTLKVTNRGRVIITNVAANEIAGPSKGPPPGPDAFALKPGESKTLVFKSHHVNRGVRRHIEVEGTTPGGRKVRADVKTSVNIEKPKVHAAAEPVVPVTAPVAPASVIPSRPVDAAQFPLVQPPASSASPSSLLRRSPGRPPSAIAFRESLRRAKDKAAFDDARSHDVLYLLEEGERHYRIAVNALHRPRDWDTQVEAWQHQVAALKLDKVEFVSLGPPGAEFILKKMVKLAVAIEQRIGVLIAVQALETLERNG